jgi:hypothetical protein
MTLLLPFTILLYSLSLRLEDDGELYSPYVKALLLLIVMVPLALTVCFSFSQIFRNRTKI